MLASKEQTESKQVKTTETPDEKQERHFLEAARKLKHFHKEQMQKGFRGTFTIDPNGWLAKNLGEWCYNNGCHFTNYWTGGIFTNAPELTDGLLFYGCRLLNIEIVEHSIYLGASSWNRALIIMLKSQLKSIFDCRRETIADMLIKQGANDWNNWLDIITTQNQNQNNTFNWPLIYKFLGGATDLSEPCQNASHGCSSEHLELAKVLIQTGRVTQNNLKTMLLYLLTNNKKFNREFVDYIINSSNAWDFQEIWSHVARCACSIVPLQYLQTLISSIDSGDGKQTILDWPLVISTAVNHCYTQNFSDMLAYAIQQQFNGKIDEVFRYPQHRNLILTLVQQNVPLKILQEKIKGMHKFIKNLDHRKLLVSKYFKKYTRCVIPHVVQIVVSCIAN